MAQQILSTNTFTAATWIVNSDATKGTHTTLAGALTSASSGDLILLQTSVTENPTLKAGVNISSFVSDSSLNNTARVKIIGKCTFTAAGSVTISGIELQTNSDFFLAVTGSADSVINLTNCFLNASNNTGISYTTSGTNSAINAFNCYGDVGTTGIAPFACSGAGTITYNQCNITNSGSSTTVCTVSSGTASILYSKFNSPITTSSTGGISVFHSVWSQPGNTTCLTHGGSGGAREVSFTYLNSGTASAISIGTGVLLNCTDVELISTNTNPITGLGQLVYSMVSMGSGTGVLNPSTLTARNNYVGGISFDAGTNVLNTYATSTWTPTIIPSQNSFTSITYGAQSGTWTKIGNMVIVQAYVAATAVTIGSGAGDINLPLPFTISSTAPTVSMGSMRIDNVTFAGKYVQAAGSSNTNFITPQQYSSAGAAANIAASAATNTMGFAFTIIYRF